MAEERDFDLTARIRLVLARHTKGAGFCGGRFSRGRAPSHDTVCRWSNNCNLFDHERRGAKKRDNLTGWRFACETPYEIGMALVFVRRTAGGRVRITRKL